MASSDSVYSKNHLSVSAYATRRDYGSPHQGGSRSPPRDRAAHAARLLGQLVAAQAATAARRVRPVPGFSPEDAATLLEVESAPGSDLPKLERRGVADVRVGAVRELANGAERAALILLPPSISVLTAALTQYRDEDTNRGAPRQQAFVAPIEQIRPAWIETLWTDPRPLPASAESIWWECWCFPDRTALVQRAAARLPEVRVGETWLRFPEMTVVPVFATRGHIERLLATINAIAELRRATDRPYIYTHDGLGDQRPWVDELGHRVEAPANEAPAVCLLDTGVNRAHPLLSSALSEADMHTHDPAWSTADDRDHGTQ